MRRFRNQEGSALIIALVFLSVFGLIVPALLDYAQTNLKLTGIARERAAELFSAGAGIDYGVQALRTNPALCPDDIAGEMTLPPITVNGRQVDVTCWTKEGALDPTGAGTRYAVITRSTSSSSLKTDVDIDMTLSGPVFNNGGFRIQKQLSIDGDVFQKDPPCSGKPPKLIVTSGSFSCTNTPVPDPPHLLPPAGPGPMPTDPAPIDVDPKCRVFVPGRYTSPPSVLDGGGTSNYFASGVYYFEDIGEWNIKRDVTIVGGTPKPAPPAEQQEIPQANPCATDLAAGAAASGFGVRFIFGGTSRLTAPSKSEFELYNRWPATGVDEGTRNISFQTVSTSAGGWKEWAGSGPVLNVTSGDPEVVIHGMVYAATAPVVLNAKSKNSQAQLLNGVVADTLEIKSGKNSEDNLRIMFTPPPPLRQILVRASAGAGPTEIRAVVQIENDVNLTTSIASWRKV